MKDDSGIKIFFNDDISADGRALKTQLKRIAQVAKLKGKEAKVSGNKVTIDSKQYHSNELSMIPRDVAESLRHEKSIADGIIFKGEKLIYSNFYPAEFMLEGTEFKHVEQYYQHSKAIHHNEIETAERIMRLSNPRRIKTLGDGIESNPAWMDQRMMTFYRGIKAKFDQNWPLQDGLISSQGKQLYEATTDTYFGCGISFESKRWTSRDWPGENVAGLILMKVREELLELQPERAPTNSTLIDIAADDNLDSSLIMDTHDNTGGERPATTNNGSANSSAQTQTPRINQTPVHRYPSQTSSTSYNTQYNDYHGYHPRGSNRRGRGRGRGRNSRGYRHQHFSVKPKKQEHKMTDSERNFLGIEPKGRSSGEANSLSQKEKGCSNPLGLSDQQIKGLAQLGLNLPLNT